MSERNVLLLPNLPTVAGLIWRPLTPADDDAMHRLSVACYQVDGLQSPQPKTEIQRVFDFLGEKMATDTLAAFTVEGEIAAMAVVFLPPAGEEQKANLNGQVHVDYRSQGLGTFILNWMEARARQLLAEAPPDLPHVLQTSTFVVMENVKDAGL